MTKFINRVGRTGIIAMLAAVLALGTGAAFTLAAGGSTIKVCVKRGSGTLYKKAKCKKKDKKLTWNSQGPRGPAGANGISQSFESFKDSSVDVASTNANAATGIAGLQLPAGQYQVIAKVHVFQSGTSSATFTPINCVLAGGGQNDTARGTINNTDSDQTLTMIAVAKPTSTTNEFVACWRDNTLNQISANVTRISAIQVNNAASVASG